MSKAQGRATISITARGSAAQHNFVQGRAGLFASPRKPKVTQDALRAWTREQGRQAIAAGVKLKKSNFVTACLAHFDHCTEDKAQTAFENWIQKKAKYHGRPPAG